jgi:hypothetical protein
VLHMGLVIVGMVLLVLKLLGLGAVLDKFD